jgi:hypothetical protein
MDLVERHQIEMIDIPDVVSRPRPWRRACAHSKRKVAEKLAEHTRTAPVVTVHPATIDRYRADLANLAEILGPNREGRNDGLIAAVRSLIAEVVVRGEPGCGPVNVEVKGRLAELLGDDEFPKRTARGGLVVAGTGVEPATYGL